MSENNYWMDDGILDPFQVKNRKRIQHVISLLSKLGNVEIESFLGRVTVNSGIDKITVRKYLGFIQDAGLIEIKDGRIIWKGKGSNSNETNTTTPL